MPSKKIMSTTSELPPISYEAAATELDALLRQMESAQLPLDQLLTSYQRGAFLLQFCRDKLQVLEDQVRVLDGNALKSWSKEV